LGGSYTGNLSAFAQELFNGDAHVVVTTEAYPDGELDGRAVVIDPRDQPMIWFYGMTGANVVPANDVDGRGTGVLTWNAPDSMQLLVTSADVANVTGVEMHRGLAGQNGDVLIHFPVEQTPGEVNGVLGEWPISEEDFPGYISPAYLAYLANSHQLYLCQSTTDHPEGEIRGQGQHPYGLEPAGLYLAELTGENTDATITVMMFHAGYQPAYGGEAITWDMYCNGADITGTVTLHMGADGPVLANLVPLSADDQLNANGYCGSGAITLEGVEGSEPWLGEYPADWPPDGWRDDAVYVQAEIQEGLDSAMIQGEVIPLWVANYSGPLD
jgi:hypothetical protein